MIEFLCLILAMALTAMAAYASELYEANRLLNLENAYLSETVELLNPSQKPETTLQSADVIVGPWNR